MAAAGAARLRDDEPEGVERYSTRTVFVYSQVGVEGVGGVGHIGWGNNASLWWRGADWGQEVHQNPPWGYVSQDL